MKNNSKLATSTLISIAAVIKYFIPLTLTFIFVTLIGTLSHEAGHLLVAKALGYEANMSYASTQVLGRPTELDSLLISVGGPLQTLLTGSFGFVLLIILSRKHGARNCVYWVPVFLSLFWLRSVFNFLMLAGGFLLTGIFSKHSDEVKIAVRLNIPLWTISSSCALIGTLLSLIICFQFIPRMLRLTFIAAGFVGCLAGYFLWLKILGPILMP